MQIATNCQSCDIGKVFVSPNLLICMGQINHFIHELCHTCFHKSSKYNQ